MNPEVLWLELDGRPSVQLYRSMARFGLLERLRCIEPVLIDFEHGPCRPQTVHEDRAMSSNNLGRNEL